MIGLEDCSSTPPNRLIPPPLITPLHQHINYQSSTNSSPTNQSSTNSPSPSSSSTHQPINHQLTPPPMNHFTRNNAKLWAGQLINLSTNKRWTLCGIYTLLIAVASLAPSRTFKDIPTFSSADLLVHFIIYGIYASLLLWALAPKCKNITTRLITTILFCSAYGILMEILQETLLPDDRTFSFWDIAANITGATCISLIMTKWIKSR